MTSKGAEEVWGSGVAVGYRFPVRSETWRPGGVGVETEKALIYRQKVIQLLWEGEV